MKFYKVISKDNKAMHGGNFDYTDYLPKSDKAGKWLPLTLQSEIGGHRIISLIKGNLKNG